VQSTSRAEAAFELRQQSDLRLFTADDLATLAATHLAAGEMGKALGHARQSFALLEECGGQGPEFPQQDYFYCYQVFAAGGENETANQALQAAYNLVMARAEKIADSALRQSFLERVPINREIVQAARQHNIQ